MENCCPLDIVSPFLEDVLNLDGQIYIYIYTTINGKLKYSYFPLIQHVIKRKKVKS